MGPAPHLGHVTMATVGQLRGSGLLLFLSMLLLLLLLLLLFSFHQSELLTVTATHGGTARTQTSSGTLRSQQTTIRR